MVNCFIDVNAKSIGIGYAILQKYWYWYCNTFKICLGIGNTFSGSIGIGMANTFQKYCFQP